MSVATYRTKQTADFLGVTDRTVRYYVEQGLCLPELGSKGRGKVCRFTRRDILALLLVRELAKHGVKIEQVKYITEMLRAHGAFIANLDFGVEIASRDFTDPNKHWVDFLDIEKIHKQGQKLFVTVFNAKSPEPDVFFKVTDSDAPSILTVEDMHNYSDCLVIDINRLSAIMNKL